ncbi:hypothetical protein RRG08_044034 [Elysia crispata]|uniref:Uncharacterized protein n=1 Tax=Elysia crispata TaxID=231223 RepID=A0AAE1CQW8_9GAST|nr:hypothetical protein RRG08_044034 [Elysia crispata]
MYSSVAPGWESCDLQPTGKGWSSSTERSEQLSTDHGGSQTGIRNCGFSMQNGADETLETIIQTCAHRGYLVHYSRANQQYNGDSRKVSHLALFGDTSNHNLYRSTSNDRASVSANTIAFLATVTTREVLEQQAVCFSLSSLNKLLVTAETIWKTVQQPGAMLRREHALCLAGLDFLKIPTVPCDLIANFRATEKLKDTKDEKCKTPIRKHDEQKDGGWKSGARADRPRAAVLFSETGSVVQPSATLHWTRQPCVTVVRCTSSESVTVDEETMMWQIDPTNPCKLLSWS